MRFRNIFIISMLVLMLPMTLNAKRFARWYTTMGNYTVILHDDLMPITAGNFITLTNNHFYDGLHYHRVVDGFVIQDGDPLGTGYGGPGYTIPDEISPVLNHDGPGVLAMAKTSQPNSAGSQYYITLAAQPDLDGDYAVFGKVIDGLDVVLETGHVPVNASHHPITPVVIDSLRMMNLNIVYFDPQDTVVTYGESDIPQYDVEGINMANNNPVPNQWFVDNVPVNDSSYCIFPEFTTLGNHTVKCITTCDGFSYTITWHVTVNYVDNSDITLPTPSLKIINNYPNPFSDRSILRFETSKTEPIKIRIFDIKGRIVRETSTFLSQKGMNTWRWDIKDNQGVNQPSGVYLYEIRTNTEVKRCKIVHLK